MSSNSLAKPGQPLHFLNWKCWRCVTGAGDVLDASGAGLSDFYGAVAALLLEHAPAKDVPLQDEVIWRDQAADDGFAQASTGIDDGLVTGASDRIRGEHDAGRVSRHHALHNDGQRDPFLGEPALLPVADSTV